ncbi:MAG: helix-turn-helix transcriptional regulator [Defluviitaleaceae bacterium]|nr:helix-turn-helix transcriptional regulator [Defluviitaleaceae bacterium]
MPNIDILGVSHRKHEYDNYSCLRENGQPAHNLLHFPTPVIVVSDGVEAVTEANACILYTPGHRQEYKCLNGLLINDYLTFTTDDHDFPSRFNLPENEVFYVRNGEEITKRLEWIAWAVADKTEPHGDDIVEAIIELFSTLSILWLVNNPGAKRQFETKQRFITLRNEMRKNPGNWTVDKMSRQVWLTRSRFSVLYSDFFGISPNADLMNMKIARAKILLETTDESVADISRACGYDSAEYFIRLFNRRMGKNPIQYRKSCKNVTWTPQN